MAKKSLPLPISPMFGGLERRESKASAIQLVDGENVYEDRGELRRRDALKSITTGPPYLLPAGLVVGKRYDYAGASYTTTTNRIFDPTVAGVGTTKILLVGCEEQFDGIDWAHMLEDTLTQSRYLLPYFVTAWTPGASATIAAHKAANSDLSPIPWFLDTTMLRSGAYESTLKRSGRISWHQSDYNTTSWPQVTIDGSTLYWVALSASATPLDVDNQTVRTDAALEGGIGDMKAPGARCFKLARVTAIVPVRGSGNAHLLLATKRVPRGIESGTQIGSVSTTSRPTQIEGIVEDEGTCAIDTVAMPAWGTSPGGSGTSKGTANKITKYRQDYSWIASVQDATASQDYQGQWGSNPLRIGLAVASATTTTIVVNSLDLPTNLYEECILEIEAKGAGGAPLRERRRVVKHSTSGGNTTFTVSPAWSTTPDTNNQVRILTPSANVVFADPDVDSSTSGESRASCEIVENEAHTLLFASSATSSSKYYEQPDRRLMDDQSLDNADAHFEIQRDIRFVLPQVDSWDHVWDTRSRQHILACGSYGLLAWDGRRLRRLAALSDASSALVELWTGIINDVNYEGNVPDLTPGSFLRSEPPPGSLIVDFGGRLVVGGIPGDPNRIIWSAPGLANNIWPKIYESLIRANDNQPVVGMRVFGGELVVWTTTQVFAAGPADNEGMMYPQPRAAGIGFANNKAVKEISIGGASALLGPNPDGVYVYTGSEPYPVLDDWKAVLKDGVNQQGLHNACAAVSKYDTLYVLAVPSAGSAVNDKILVYDYQDKFWWQWNAPFGGVSSLAIDRDKSGREQLLFGFEDGHVGVLAGFETDDGDAITGRARTPPIQIDGSTKAFSGIMVTAKELGATDEITMKSYIDQQPGARQTWGGVFDAGADLYGTGVFGTATWAGKNMVTRKLNLPAATKGEIYQAEVSGSKRWMLRKLELLLKPLSRRHK